jgi:hypothetical protein
VYGTTNAMQISKLGPTLGAAESVVVRASTRGGAVKRSDSDLVPWSEATLTIRTRDFDLEEVRGCGECHSANNHHAGYRQ